MPLRKFKILLITVVLLSSLGLLTMTYAQQTLPLPLPLDGQPRATVELVINGGFEINNDGDKVPDGWESRKINLPKKDKLKCNKPDKVIAHSGTCAFIFKGNPGWETSKLRQIVPDTSAIVDGSVLTLSAYVDPKSGDPDSKIANVKVRFSDNSKLKLDLFLPTTPTSGYTLLTKSRTVTIPAGLTISDVRVVVRYSRPTGKFLIDDVSLTVSSPGTPPVTPTHTPPVETWTQQTKLIANDGAPLDGFGGSSVSLSADGNTALVGAFLHDVVGMTDHGAAYVYVRSGNTWTEQARLVASDGDYNDQAGYAVSLSADGNTAVVGAPLADGSIDFDQGAVYVYVRSGGTWTEDAKLTASDGAQGDEFGRAVSISGDGNTVIVGMPYYGYAYVYVRSGGTWSEQASFTGSDSTMDDNFAQTVSLSADGSMALIGSSMSTIGMNPLQGAAYVFVRSGGIWTEQDKLVASDGFALELFGYSVALNADGSTAVVGAMLDGIGGNIMQGSAYVFARSGSTWTQQARLISNDGWSEDRLGGVVSISADGNTVLATAQGDDIESNSNQGSAYVFVRSGGAWTQKSKLIASDGNAFDSFGTSGALSGNGLTVLVGALLGDGPNPNQGAAWVYNQ